MVRQAVSQIVPHPAVIASPELGRNRCVERRRGMPIALSFQRITPFGLETRGVIRHANWRLAELHAYHRCSNLAHGLVLRLGT